MRERKYTYQKVGRSHVGIEEIQDRTDNEPIVGTRSQLEVEIPVESNDIVLHLCKSSRVNATPEFYEFHLNAEGDTLFCDKTLINLEKLIAITKQW